MERAEDEEAEIAARGRPRKASLGVGRETPERRPEREAVTIRDDQAATAPEMAIDVGEVVIRRPRDRLAARGRDTALACPAGSRIGRLRPHRDPRHRPSVIGPRSSDDGVDKGVRIVDDLDLISISPRSMAAIASWRFSGAGRHSAGRSRPHQSAASSGTR
ncbi:hypothetical protein D3273_02865 [Lichenibacterium minor]|uniref:Uncharacterized protein n=1 Tax=Lichenibacterium minor TaxID=2316528 RepID=A0A4V1RV51_9HYPH|nr:hypothetical protein [Lichenibacterium minor]RYC33434.1 hypothetical protein D3273_02865 [Lichenibacterium minor]